MAEKEQAEKLLNEASDEIECLKVQFNKLNCEKEIIETTHSNTRQQLIAEMNVLKSQHALEMRTLRLQCDDEISAHKQKLVDERQSAELKLAETLRASEAEKAGLLARIR